MGEVSDSLVHIYLLITSNLIEWIGPEIRQSRPQEAFWAINTAEDQNQLSISQYLFYYPQVIYSTTK